MFSDIKVFLRDLLFSSSISLTDCFKLFIDFLTVFFHFKLQTLYLITVIAS